MSWTGLPELNAVVAVATHRSFRRAASELGMSPSALSHAIPTLEAKVGVRLFNRTTRSVSLTEAGTRLLEQLRPALGQIAEAMDAVNTFRDTPTGLLRINASDNTARQIMRPLVLPFLERNPDMQIDLVAQGSFVDIVAEGFDAGIRLIESIPQDMVITPLGPSMRFAVVGSPAYFQNHSIPKTPAELAQHRCIRSRLPSGALFRWEFQKHGEQIALEVPGQLTLNQHAPMIEAALAGAGLAWVTESAVLPHLESGALIRVLLDWTPPTPGLALYYPRNRHVPAGLRAFVAFVRENGLEPAKRNARAARHASLVRQHAKKSVR